MRKVRESERSGWWGCASFETGACSALLRMRKVRESAE